MCPKVLGREVGPVAFGMMSLTTNATPITDDQAVEVLKAALEAGSNYWNGGSHYAMPHEPHRNSAYILRKYFEKYPEDADKVVINYKVGLVNFMPLGTKENISKSIDDTLEALGPVGRIAQIEASRKDPNNDYEKLTLGTIGEYVKAGKIDGISATEISTETLRSAVKAGYKITAIELELSLFSLEALDNGLLAACAEYDIPVLAYSPIGKGMLGGEIKKPEDLGEYDFRRYAPRFQGENFYKNLELVKSIQALAQRKGCTPGQIAIGWIIAVSKRPGMPTIIPLPGSVSKARVKENATIVDLTEDDLKEIEALLASFKPAGDRYPEGFMPYLNA